MPMMPYSPSTEVPTSLCRACPFSAVCLSTSDPDEAWRSVGGEETRGSHMSSARRIIPLGGTPQRATLKRMRCYQRGYHLPAHMRTKGV